MQEEIFTDRSIDVIFIRTTNMTHVPIGIAVLAAGKPVIVKKAMSTTIADTHRSSPRLLPAA
jgi:predicted dehydrogenase